MKDSQIKKGIDEAIGEEKWLTDDVIQKMMQPKPPKKKKSPTPILTTAFIACIALFLILVEYNKKPEQQITEENLAEMPSGQIETEQFYNSFEDEEAAEYLINYLRALELKDYEKVKSILGERQSNFYELLFQRYENVDFKSIKLLKVLPISPPIGSIVYLTHTNLQDGNTYYHQVSIEYDFDGTLFIREYIDTKWPIFEPFELPKTIHLNYIEVAETAIQLTPLSRELKPISEPFTLSDGGVAMFYQRDETIYFIIEKDGKYHYIPYFDYYANEESQYFIHEVPLQTENAPLNVGLVESKNNSTYKKRIFFYYSETKENYQYYESTNTISDLVIDLDQDGQFEIIFDDWNGSIVKIEDGSMKATNIEKNISHPEWVFITIELIGSIATVSYSDENGSNSGLYDFKSTNEMILFD